MVYKAAVIGCGRIGFEFDEDPKRKYIATHTGAYNFSKETDLVSVCDMDTVKLNKCLIKYPQVNGYSNLDKMLKKEKLDIVSICTPADTHCTVLKKLIKFPVKAIFCEKPLAGNIKDARKMVELCRKRKILLQVDHQRRFDPLHINLRKFIKDKKMGDVQQVNFYYTAGIRNTGSHMFDLLRFLFGDAQWIEGVFSKNQSYKDDDPNIDGLIKFKNGILATFQACDVKNYLIFELNCLLEKGRIVLTNSGFDVIFHRAKDSRNFSGYKELEAATSPFNAKYKRNFMVNAIKHISDCIGKKKESASSGLDGLRASELIEASIFSAKNNGKRIIL